MDPGLCGYAESLDVRTNTVETEFYEDRSVMLAMYVGAPDDGLNHLISDMSVKQKGDISHNPSQAVSLSFFFANIFMCGWCGCFFFYYLYFIVNEKKGDNHVCL